MKRLLIASFASILAAMPAMADGKIYVKLPDMTGITGAEAESFLEDVVTANVISSNCPAFEVTDEEWSLLTDSADLLARGQLGLSIDAYDERYYDPAFALLDKAGACDEHGPDVQPTIERLIALGGLREALPDQEAAYAAEQAREKAWDEWEAALGRKTKTK